MYYKIPFIFLFFVLFLFACNKGTENSSAQVIDNSLSLIEGQKLFANNCARCHGRRAKGTEQGPPFIHTIYKSSHHGDQAFYRAIENHWKFGNMAPIKSLSKREIAEIINYIRHEQQKAGIN